MSFYQVFKETEVCERRGGWGLGTLKSLSKGDGLQLKAEWAVEGKEKEDGD